MIRFERQPDGTVEVYSGHGDMIVVIVVDPSGESGLWLGGHAACLSRDDVAAILAEMIGMELVGANPGSSG